MTQANIELLHALREAGASEEAAEAAARSVSSGGAGLATEADVRRIVEAAVAASEARLSGRILTAVGVVVAAQALAAGVLIAVLG